MKSVKKFLIKNKYPVIIFFLAILFFQNLLLDFDKILSSSDIIESAYFPKYFFVNFFKANHQIPFWNPHMFSGTPFLANPSAGVFYPIYLLFLIFPTINTFGYIFALDIFLIGIFTYLFARSINLDKYSSFISGVAFMFSSTVIFRIYPGHLYVIDAIVWFPILLFTFEKVIKTKKILYGILGAIIIALTILVGHSQFTFLNLFFASLYFFLRIISDYFDSKDLKSNIKQIGIFALAFILGIGLSAIQLTQSLQLTQLSQRSGGISFEFASDFALHPYQLITLVLPHFFGSVLSNTFWGKGNFWETCGYIGIGALFFMLVAIIFNRNKYVFIFIIISILCILLSLGKYTPIFPLFFNYVPGFELFRAPGRFLYIYAFSFSILAGIGLNYVLNKKINKSEFGRLKKIFTSAILLSFLILVISLFLYTSNNLFYYEKFVLRNSFAVGINHLILYKQTIYDLISFGIISTLLLIATYGLLTKKISSKIFKIIIFLIVFFDLWLFNQGVIILKSPQELFKPSSIVEQIKKDDSVYRVLTSSGVYNTELMTNGKEILTGYEGVYLKNYRDFLWLTGTHSPTPYESFIKINSIENLSVLNLLNTKYIIWEEKLNNNNLNLIKKYESRINNENREFYLYENLTYFPRAYIVTEKTVDDKKILITEKSLDVPKSSLKFLGINKSNIQSEVNDLVLLPNRISLNVAMQEKGYLVLSEIWYPGWKAYDNGQEKEILRANYIFRSIKLDKGNHKIIFNYESSTYKLGKYISLGSLIIVIVILMTLYKIRNEK